MVSAAVYLKGGISGIILLGQDPSITGTRISGGITGLTPGKHGLHIHESGNITASCADAGGHYNPFKKAHGGPGDKERHVGDLGNIVANKLGIALFDFTFPEVQLSGEHSVVGRALVLHAGEDDLGKGGFSDSLTTGHAGDRLACGVIRAVGSLI
ncbi:hypothetical protein IWW50_002436 [Coemansia erecta]|nr:hypothetical protein IWW50_002436 [Coemansia erecta]